MSRKGSLSSVIRTFKTHFVNFQNICSSAQGWGDQNAGIQVSEELNFIQTYLRYDSEIGKFFWKKAPGYRNDLVGKEAGKACGRNNERWMIKMLRRNYYRAHLVFLVETGKLPHKPMTIDHINRNSLDDRWENLREVTYKENSANSCLRRNEFGKYYRGEDENV